MVSSLIVFSHPQLTGAADLCPSQPGIGVILINWSAASTLFFCSGELCFALEPLTAAADFSAAAFRRTAPERLILMVQEPPDGFPAHTLPFRSGKLCFSLEPLTAAADFSAAA